MVDQNHLTGVQDNSDNPKMSENEIIINSK
jgi:hypothetical protein